MVQRIESRSVEVIFEGERKRIAGVTQHTRCSDVISLAAHTYMVGKDQTELAMFESSCGAKRELSPTSKLLKVMRCWGNGEQAQQLALREANDNHPNVKRSLVKRALRKVKSVFRVKNRKAQNTNKDSTSTYTAADGIGTKDNEPGTCIEQCPYHQHAEGNLDLMNRYFDAVFAHNLMPIPYVPSTGGDFDNHIPQVVESSYVDTSDVGFDTSVCDVHQLNTAFVSNTSGQFKCYDTVDSITDAYDPFVCMNDELYDPNMAFISASVSHAQVNHSDPFNDCITDDISMNSSFSDEDSAFDDTNIDSDSEKELTFERHRNLGDSTNNASTTLDKLYTIKQIFGTRTSHSAIDDNLESFMKTRHFDPDIASDEGLGSLESVPESCGMTVYTLYMDV